MPEETVPFKPLAGILKVGTITVGSGILEKASFKWGEDVSEHYGVGDAGAPTILSGNKHYTGKFSKCWLGTTLWTAIIAGSPLSLIFYPLGLAKSYFTIAGCRFKTFDYTMDEDTVVAENVEFVGTGITATTV